MFFALRISSSVSSFLLTALRISRSVYQNTVNYKITNESYLSGLANSGVVLRREGPKKGRGNKEKNNGRKTADQ